jgi:hypothetical protein
MSRSTRLLLDDQEKLNSEIMKIYDSIKDRHSYDIGWANADYLFHYNNLEELNELFVKHVTAFLKNKKYKSQRFKHVKSELKQLMRMLREDDDNNFFEYFLYDISCVIRDFDGHGLDADYNITGEDEESGDDYPDIEHLKRLSSNGREFLNYAVQILPKEAIPVEFTTTYSQMEVSAGFYFSIMYDLLLKTVLGQQPASPTRRRRSRSRGGTRKY